MRCCLQVGLVALPALELLLRLAVPQVSEAVLPLGRPLPFQTLSVEQQAHLPPVQEYSGKTLLLALQGEEVIVIVLCNIN